MPVSDPPEMGDPPGLGLAVTAEALYLVNLLLLPGIAFIALVWLYLRYRATAAPLAANHLRQTLVASLCAGVLLIAANLIILLLGGYQAPYTWVVLVIYFTVCHSALVIAGMFGLSKAMAGQPFWFPLIGPRQ
jgi:hypothetical protein